jgi:hypothetical protein
MQTETVFKEKHGVCTEWEPMTELTIASPYTNFCISSLNFKLNFTYYLQNIFSHKFYKSCVISQNRVLRVEQNLSPSLGLSTIPGHRNPCDT